MLSVFCGQLTGTAVGNHVYAQGGWIKSGSTSIGFIGAALVVCFARAPWEKGWVGWSRGWGIRRRDLGTMTGDAESGTLSDGQKKGDGDVGKAAGAEVEVRDDDVGSRGEKIGDAVETEKEIEMLGFGKR